jgi:DNA-binding MarR family transcriptional regulator
MAMASRPAARERAELLAALERALRDITGLAVLHSQVIAQRLGINSTDLECLGLLMHGPASAGAIAAATGITSGAATGVIDRLTKAGFVRREVDESDRRKIRVAALPAVQETVVPLFEPMQRVSAQLLKCYRDEELALILDFLTRAHAASLGVITQLQQSPPGGLRRARRAKARSPTSARTRR